MKIRLTLLATTIVFLGALFTTARHFPPVNSDEVVRAVIGVHRIHGEAARYSLYDDIFAPQVYILRDVLPDQIISIYHYWLGTWMVIGRQGYMAARASSIVAIALVVWVFFAVGRRLGGPRVGLLCACLGVFNPLVLLSASIARPESLLLLVSVSILWMIVSFPDSVTLKPFLVGMTCALLTGIHVTGIAVGAGLFVFYFLQSEEEDRVSRSLLYGAGVLAGLLAIFAMVDAKRFQLGMQTIHGHLLRPPFLQWPWHPVDWAVATLTVLWQGRTYYLEPGMAPGWPWSLQAWWVMTGIVWGFGFWRTPRKDTTVSRAFMGAALAVFLCSLLLVRARESLYGTNYIPFLIPPLALSLARLIERRRLMVLALAALLLIGSLAGYARFVQASMHRGKTYDALIAEVRARCPGENLKVAAPAVLWFGWKKEFFRDSGAILLSYWYTGGEPDVKTWLGAWKPDILILDPATQRVIKRPLALSLGRPVEDLGMLDAEGPYGQWKMYRIHW